MIRLKQELKRMWANVWLRSLVELILVVILGVVFTLLLQNSESGLQVIQQVKTLMGYPQP